MAFRLSRHARDEMARRGIPQHMVDDVLANPQLVIDLPDGKKAYQSQVDFGAAAPSCYGRSWQWT